MDRTGPVAIRATRAFDGRTFLPEGALVLCEDGSIVGLRPVSAPVPTGWPVHDFDDATVLPGLIDCHVHLCGDSRNGALDRLPDFTDEEVHRVIETALLDQLAAGVTTVRDLGDRRWAVVDWRDRANANSTGGWPTIVASGPPITTRRGHCWHMGGEAEQPSEIHAAIGERAERRVDVVKVMSSGGAMTAGTDVLDCQYTVEQLRLVVEAAHAAGLAVTSHAHGLSSVERSIAAGVDGIEHCSCFTEQGIQLPDAVLERLVSSGITVCPTLGKKPGVDPPPRVVEMQQRTGTTLEARESLAARLCNAGVSVVSGVDGGISEGKPHGILPMAVAGLVDGGVAPTTALATATSNAARVCELEHRKGSLLPGHDADLLIVDGDPVADIAALRQVRAVYLRGETRATSGRDRR
jgi:imidazolonepropionase-like amidohydrolase